MTRDDIGFALKLWEKQVDTNTVQVSKILTSYDGIVIRDSNGTSWRYRYLSGTIEKVPHWRART